MSYYNNGSYGTPFGWREHPEQSGYFPGMPQQQSMPIAGNPSGGSLYVTGESRWESYLQAGAAPNADPWSNYPPPTVPSAYRGGEWQVNRYGDQIHIGGSSFGTTGSDTAGPHMNLGMESVGLSNDVVPISQTHTFQRQSASQGRTQTHGSHLQSTPWDYPEHTARQHGSHRSSNGAFGTRSGVPPVQPSGYSVNPEHRTREAVQTGHLHPVTDPSYPATRSDAVSPPATTSPTRSRGEWWGPIDATMFECLWTTRGVRCSAQIPGDRKSITSHLRNHGDFTSDGEKIPCAWAGCTALPMQRRNITRHILACHLEVKVPCRACGMPLSRADAGKKHLRVCPKASVLMRMGAGEEDEGVY